MRVGVLDSAWQLAMYREHVVSIAQLSQLEEARERLLDVIGSPTTVATEGGFSGRLFVVDGKDIVEISYVCDAGGDVKISKKVVAKGIGRLVGVPGPTWRLLSAGP